MTVGISVQMISTTLLPWVWAGRSVSPGLRRYRRMLQTISPSTARKIAIARAKTMS